jgi:hypothetical protein
LAFQLPQATIEIGQRADRSAAWQTQATVDLNLQHGVFAALSKPAHEVRQLNLTWSNEVQVTEAGPGSDGGARIAEMFAAAWQGWTNRQSQGGAFVPDVQIGPARLRLDQLRPVGNVLAGSFSIPTIKLTNLAEEPFIYETKGPFSGWSTPYTLAPGQSQEYPIPYPLTYRRSGAAGSEFYILETGSHSEYRVPWSGGAPRLFTAKRP